MSNQPKQTKGKYIKQMGVELEGGWDTKPDGAGTCHSDGSVCVDAPYVGEYVSEPYSRLASLLSFVDKHYPDTVNDTCGMHVHISMNTSADYLRLMHHTFHEYFLTHLHQWGEKAGIKSKAFWHRLNGGNHYCCTDWGDDCERHSMGHHPDTQIESRDKDSCRYAALNFCYGLHKTLEIRILPQFKSKDIAQAAISAVIQIVNDYLDEMPALSEAKTHSYELVTEDPIEKKQEEEAPEDITKVYVQEDITEEQLLCV